MSRKAIITGDVVEGALDRRLCFGHNFAIK